jgi:hypothetical protein
MEKYMQKIMIHVPYLDLLEYALIDMRQIVQAILEFL